MASKEIVTVDMEKKDEKNVGSSDTTSTTEEYMRYFVNINDQQYDINQKHLFVPPMNFAMVCSGVYRAGYPGVKNQQFLKQLKLKSIICLDGLEYRHKGFLEQENIRLFQFDVKVNKEPFKLIPLELIREILCLIIDKRNHPLLIHCNKGKNRVGIVIGCLRRIQNWSTTFTISEYQTFFGQKMRLIDHQYIEMFQPKQVLYDSRYKPNWL